MFMVAPVWQRERIAPVLPALYMQILATPSAGLRQDSIPVQGAVLITARFNPVTLSATVPTEEKVVRM